MGVDRVAECQLCMSCLKLQHGRKVRKVSEYRYGTANYVKEESQWVGWGSVLCTGLCETFIPMRGQFWETVWGNGIGETLLAVLHLQPSGKPYQGPRGLCRSLLACPDLVNAHSVAFFLTVHYYWLNYPNHQMNIFERIPLYIYDEHTDYSLYNKA